MRSYFGGMFIRKNKNRSGSISIQIGYKENCRNKIIKTVGVAKTKREEELLLLLANTEIERLQGMQSIFVEHDDLVVDNFVDSIYQLTYKSNVGFIYDKNSFKLKGGFHYPTQGWGLTTNGNELIMSDGSAALLFINPETLKQTRYIIVSDDKSEVGFLNELEYIEGEIYANIWKTDLIVRISPETGKVTGWIDLTGINPDPAKLKYPHVLNGIAYDKKKKRLLITGKCWPEIYEIELVPLVNR